MIIPKGKKFSFQIRDLDAEKVGEIGSTYYVPARGYLGNAYIGQDMNISIQNNFTKPFEGILGMVPHTLDFAVQAAKGISLNNARFTHMKYWAGTEAPDLNVQLIFETQVDSYYDVYYPVTQLLSAALPKEVAGGFYKPPTPSIKYIAEEAVNFVSAGAEQMKDINANNIGGGKASEKLKNTVKSVNSGYDTAIETLQNLVKNVENTGLETHLSVGDNFLFPRIMIKNASVNFSNELAYAPIHTLNGLTPPPKAFINPYKLGESATVALSSSILTAFAAGNNALTGLGQFVNDLPGAAGLENNLNVDQIASFPIRAEVTLSFDLMFPLTRNQDGVSPLSLSKVFSADGNQFLGY